jgi:hypothetical protein
LLGLKPSFVAKDGYMIPYTQLPENILLFETRKDAEKKLMNDQEIIVDIRHQK